MLDELDGKQARRTGNASPLGLLFDHGFDAMSLGLIAVGTIKVVQIGDNNMAVFLNLMCGFTFYMATLEEYYTGEMIIGPGNTVTDGSVVLCVGFVLMGIYGNSFWTDTFEFSGDKFKYNYAFGIFTIFCTGVTCL